MPRVRLKQRADGRYVCRRGDKYFFGSTQAEALAARDAYIEEEKYQKEHPDITVAKYAAMWLPLYKSGVSVRTYNQYAGLLEAMCRVIGDKLLKDVKPEDLTRVYSTMVGKSQSYLHKARITYIAMFEAAAESDRIRRNPAKSSQAQPPKGSSGTHRALTDEEISLITTTEHRMRPLAALMLFAGLRRGEALALVVDRDVDFDLGVIHVEGSVRFASNQPQIAQTKTRAGKRTVPLLPALREALEGIHGYISKAGDTPQTEMEFSRGWENYQKALSAAAGHPVSVRCHDLRHTFCTQAITAGIDAKTVMLWMGHSDERMIMRVYDHVTEARTTAAVKALETIGFSGCGGQNGGQRSDHARLALIK